MKNIRTFCLLGIAIFVGLSVNVFAETPEVRALQVFEQHKGAVVTVEMVVRQHISFMGMGSESEESRIETAGTVIDDAGLTVVALSATDPMGMMAGLMGGRLGDEMQMQSEVADVRILVDGAVIPASVVLRDKDHDLAFLRPNAPPESPLPFLNTDETAQPEMLDPVVVIQRMGRVANRVAAVDLTRIRAIVERPRRFYLAASDAVGAPAFALDGKWIGIFVLRTLPQQDGGGSFPLSFMSEMQDSVSAILVPAATIKAAAAQAPAVTTE